MTEINYVNGSDETLAFCDTCGLVVDAFDIDNNGMCSECREEFEKENE